ncbi:MAG: hypothetical protein ACR2OH_09330 [Microthrixaceae bacterium]
MSAVAVASAWAGFQSAKWSGQQSLTLAEAGAVRSFAESEIAAGEVLADIDGEHWLAWVEAEEQGDSSRAQVIIERMRPEFRLQFEEWRSSDRDVATPFELDSYDPGYLRAAAELYESADDLAGEAREFNERSDNYVLVTVGLASVLFLAGISQNAGTRAARVLVVAACVLALAAFVTLVILPVRI